MLIRCDKTTINIITTMMVLLCFVENVESKSLERRNNNIINDSINTTMERRLPQAIIIGVKKAGTRALLEYLRLHPLVKGPGPEIHFFDRHYHMGLEWYRNQMPLTTSDQVTIEKTPCYYIRREVPSRVYNMSPDVKLLIVVRDPVKRAISDYTQAVTKKRVKRSFADTVFLSGESGTVDISRSAVRIGFYGKHLKKWLRYFTLESMLFVSGENLASANPYDEMRRVEQFLNLPPAIKPAQFRFNATKGFPCIKKLRRSVTTAAAVVVAAGNNSNGSFSINNTNGGNNSNTTNNYYHCLGKTKGRTHVHVEKLDIEKLNSFYRPFNEQFFQMVGRNFGWNSNSNSNNNNTYITPT